MFKENKRTTATDTLIGQGTIAEGKILCEAGLRIEGEYRGDIECKGDVIIGESGIARSNIVANDVTLAGQLFGDVVTKGRLVITSSGQVTGNITAHSLIIQEGGKINGGCRMELPPDAKSKPVAELDSASGNANESKDNRAKSRQAG
jgi:Integral membrane protein CcmA involved in cell shape determination